MVILKRKKKNPVLHLIATWKSRVRTSDVLFFGFFPVVSGWVHSTEIAMKERRGNLILMCSRRGKHKPMFQRNENNNLKKKKVIHVWFLVDLLNNIVEAGRIVDLGKVKFKSRDLWFWWFQDKSITFSRKICITTVS